MDFLHSVSLIVALLVGILALTRGAFVLLSDHAGRQPAARAWAVLLSNRVAVAALTLGTFSLVISVVVHHNWGHGPTTVTPMAFWRLLAEHEVFIVAAVVLASGVTLNAYATRVTRPPA